MDASDLVDVVSILHPLYGKLVEIKGLEAPLEADAGTASNKEEAKTIDANGQKGRAVGWDEEGGKYVVETFDGVLIGVPEGNCDEFEPPAPEDGGFDVAWPSGPEPPDLFAESIVGCLMDKGYCVIQMFTPATTREEAFESSRDLDIWYLPTKELEVAYLGYDNSTKYTNLPDDRLKNKPANALAECDRVLTNLGVCVNPVLEEYMGFQIWGRRSGMVRVPFADSTEESLLRPSGMDERDYQPGGKVYGHINFLERRKLHLMYMVRNEGGGHVWLYPTGNAGPLTRNVKLPITENKLLVTLPEFMSYSYKPRGDNLLVQTWYVSPPFVADPEDARVVTLPDLHQGDRAMVMSLEFRYAGDAYGPARGCCMWTSGTDGVIQLPSMRFDVDLYYDPNDVLYTKHGACMDDALMTGFDNEFFCMTEEEVKAISPAQRNVLETGFEALQAADYTRSRLKGLHCGLYLGDAGSDWSWSAGSYRGEMNPYLHTGVNAGVTCSRFSHIFGMRGPAVTVDTGCSSSLVALGQAHRGLRDTMPGQLRSTSSFQIKRALVVGVNLIDGLQTFFSCCVAKMLSSGGRCFTFDESASGFVRGEGCGACFVKQGDGDEDAQLMRACILGSSVNQDGRSASLTAPNGPSQEQCIRASMVDAGLGSCNVSTVECHGTGTSLGDPIEMGSLMTTMKDQRTPLIISSAKTSIGHTEACGGMGGIAKSIIMLLGMNGSPNLHLKCINPFIEFNGFPGLFMTEIQDTACKSGIAGVGSFGIGGTNSRADLWGRSMLGFRATKEVNTYQVLRVKSAQYDRIKEYGTPGPQYKDEVFIIGTWNGWSKMTRMEILAEGEYGATIALGNTCCEKFRLVLNQDCRQTLYPSVDCSAEDSYVCGPDWEAKDRSWLLDGRAEKAVPGDIYRIKFEWGFSWDLGETRRVTWEKIGGDDAVGELQVDCRTFMHKYYVCGSWTTGKMLLMDADPKDSSIHRSHVRVGLDGKEWFHIVCDRDEKQVFHPAVAGAVKNSIPICGPDGDGKGKHWIIQSRPGDLVTVTFQLTPERSTLTMESRQGSKTWSSDDNNDWHDYWVYGTWLNWELDLMTPQLVLKDRFEYELVLGDRGVEDFQIVLDRDLEQVLYPHRGQATLGEGAICGPDDQGDGLNWRIRGRPGSRYKIQLDFNEPPLEMVWWCQIPQD